MIPIVCAISVVRAGSATRTTRFAVAAIGRERGRGDRLRGRGDVELQAGRRRPDHDLAGRRDLEPGVLRLARHGRREPLEVLLGLPPGDRDVGAAPGGQARAAARSASAAPASASRRRRAGAAPRAPCAPASPRPARSAPLTFGLGRRERERDRPRRGRSSRALRRRRPRRRRGRARGPAGPRRPATESPLRTSLASTPATVDRAGDLVELVRRPPRRRPRRAARRRPRTTARAGAGSRAPARSPRPRRPRASTARSPVGLDPELRGRERRTADRPR